jgi:hypothetical protein
MQSRNFSILVGLFCCADLAALSGCASLARPLPERKAAEVYASYGKTWGAAVDYFARSGISLDTTDRASGVIRADVTAMPRDKTYFASCSISVVEPYWEGDQGWNWSTKHEQPPVGAPFTAIVQGDSTRATVSVTANWIDAHGNQMKCSTISDPWEQQTEAAIKSKAEER